MFFEFLGKWIVQVFEVFEEVEQSNLFIILSKVGKGHSPIFLNTVN